MELCSVALRICCGIAALETFSTAASWARLSWLCAAAGKGTAPDAGMLCGWLAGCRAGASGICEVAIAGARI